MQIKNLTPHIIKIYTEEGTIEIEPEKTQIRLKETKEYAFTFEGVDVYKTQRTIDDIEYDFDPYCIYIVSSVAYPALKAKYPKVAFATPGETVRDANGNVIGCKNLYML